VTRLLPGQSNNKVWRRGDKNFWKEKEESI
jgi:hypothetical protein